jgi:F-type H+-transporting ATPase subunit delta
MASTTRQSLAKAVEALAKEKKVSLNTAHELFDAAAALDNSIQLRGALSDPSADAARREKLANGVFKGLSTEALKVIQVLVGLRWSSPRDLAKSCESLAVTAVAMQLDAKSLQSVGEELYSVQSLIDQNGELELAMSTTRAKVDAKQELLKKLLGKQLSEPAQLLVMQAVNFAHKTSFSQLLRNYGEVLAEQANRKTATVSVARPLSEKQLQELKGKLSKAFDSELIINQEVDESIIGGMRIQVAGEVIDATVASKLNNARLQLS